MVYPYKAGFLFMIDCMRDRKYKLLVPMAPLHAKDVHDLAIVQVCGRAAGCAAGG